MQVDAIGAPVNLRGAHVDKITKRFLNRSLMEIFLQAEHGVDDRISNL